ncbi:MAG TPA: hypothetical protein PLD80_06090 [Rugosibacter sp.]|nr:hypothetical protein [Rugosibacter sp.]
MITSLPDRMNDAIIRFFKTSAVSRAPTFLLLHENDIVMDLVSV